MNNTNTKNAKQGNSLKPFFRLLKDARFPIWLFVIDTLIGMVFSTVMVKFPQLKGEIMAGEIFDNVLLVKYVVLTLVMSALMIVRNYYSSWIGFVADRRLREVVWHKIVRMPLSESDKVPPTSLVSRVVGDTSTVTYAVNYVFLLINWTYSLILTLIMVGSYNWNFVYLIVGLSIPLIVLGLIPTRFMYKSSDGKRTAMSSYTNFLAERLGSMEHIKAFAAEEEEEERNNVATREYFRQNVKYTLAEHAGQPMGYSLEAVCEGVFLIYGGYLFNAGLLSGADILTLYWYKYEIYLNLIQYIFFWGQIRTAQGETRAVSEMMYIEPEQMEREYSFAIPDRPIRMENVSFDYGNGVKVLNELNMEIPLGKVTAIVGPSGSGKTTVLKLLERLYQPTAGTIWFGDKKAEDIHLNEWRNSFSMVPQNSPLLFGTIRENITYGLENQVGEKELTAAMKAANVDEMIQRMPNGLDTAVGDVGDRLSGGERQRIALARMMIRDPDYLLLDEATSALDAENEYEVTKSLQKIMHGRTTVVVAHNLRTIEDADNIVFMENGRVVDQGTHKELYASNARYHKYVDLQHI